MVEHTASAEAAEIDGAVAELTVPRQFVDTVDRCGNRVAIRAKDGDNWAEWTWLEYADRAGRAAAGLRALGVRRGDRVVMMLRNCPEFYVLDMAAMLCGATPISIYNSSSVDQVTYLARHSKALVGIAEDPAYLARFRDARRDDNALRHVGIVRPGDATQNGGDAEGDTFTFDELLDHEPLDLADAAATCDLDDFATVIYTSGTTGQPKGVAITHRNACWTGECLRRRLPFDTGYAGKRLVSYLPMAHIAERMVSHYLHTALGFDVTTCPETRAIAEYLAAVHPHVLFGVPRIFEKIQAGVEAVLAADPEQAKRFDEAVHQSAPIAISRSWDDASADDQATWEQLDSTMFRPMRQLLGVDELEMAISGAAPIRAELLLWFRAIGVPLSEIYGMSESTGPIAWTPERIKPGTVGPACPGVEITLGDDRELLCRGGNVFPGYLDQPEQTAEALADGWLHTGDIATIDDDGYVTIVDRKKELIVTAGGKNVSPANLEAALRTIPLVGHAFAVGDRRPFVAAIVTLDPDDAPQWAKRHGIESTDLADLASNPKIREEIERHLSEVMEPFNNAERVKKLAILGDEWNDDSEFLTPTQKLKRRALYEAYSDVIDALYA